VGLYETLGSIFTEPQIYNGEMIVERELTPHPPQPPVEIPLQGQMHITRLPVQRHDAALLMGKIVAVPHSKQNRRVR
jgi:hypothetical protein